MRMQMCSTRSRRPWAQVPSSRPPAWGRYAFAHALIHSVLYGSLTGTRRARLHLRIGEVLEGMRPASPETDAELAYHFLEASPLDTGGRAVRHARRPARAHSSSWRMRTRPAGSLARSQRSRPGRSPRSGVISFSISPRRTAAPVTGQRCSPRSRRPLRKRDSSATPSGWPVRRLAASAKGRPLSPMRRRLPCSTRPLRGFLTRTASCGRGCSRRSPSSCTFMRIASVSSG